MDISPADAVGMRRKGQGEESALDLKVFSKET
jgi:hypothetical protein